MHDRSIFIIIFSISIMYYLFILYKYPAFDAYLNEFDEISKPCRVPELNPFDKSIAHFFEKPDDIICSPNGPLVESDLQYLYVNRNLLPAYGIDNIKKFKCCYQIFERKTPDITESDDDIVYLGKCKQFFFKTKVEAEFVEVFCRYRGEIIYHDMHCFVPIKKNEIKFKENRPKLNVLMFGIDSLSQMNFQRQMPKTKKYIDEKLNSILMSGYNKAGDNTFPNVIAILTGHSVDEIIKLCWTGNNDKFDECHFIWNDYSDNGYLTAFSEDASYMGLFNLYGLGFQEPPTHYYWKTFDYYAENTLRSDYCLGPRLVHQVLIDYTKKFTLTLKDTPYFGIFWSCTLSHDELNHPSLSDDDYVQFFEHLKTNVLNNTVVVFLSDHGMKTGDILETYQGYLEDRLPLLYFILPPWFQEIYPFLFENMKENAKRLTSNYDIYKTLLDLLDLDQLTLKYISNNEKDNLEKRGLSLFSLVPENRTCEMAGIPSHWCTCKNRKQIQIHGATVVRISYFIVNHINNLLLGYNECAKLKLKYRNSAYLAKALTRNDNYLKEYTVALTTEPGDAIFESTVRCKDCNDENFFEISGSVSRLNRYGNQSICVSNNMLKMYCYCIK